MAIGSRMAAMIFKGPPQPVQVFISIPKTRARSSAHFFTRGNRRGSGGLAGSALDSGTRDGRGTMSERILACGAKKNQLKQDLDSGKISQAQYNQQTQDLNSDPPKR